MKNLTSHPCGGWGVGGGGPDPRTSWPATPLTRLVIEEKGISIHTDYRIETPESIVIELLQFLTYRDELIPDRVNRKCVNRGLKTRKIHYFVNYIGLTFFQACL